MLLFENSNKDCEKWNKKNKSFTELLLKVGFFPYWIGMFIFPQIVRSERIAHPSTIPSPSTLTDPSQ